MSEIRRTGSEDECFASYAAGDHDEPPAREEQCELNLSGCHGDAVMVLRDGDESLLACAFCANTWLDFWP